MRRRHQFEPRDTRVVGIVGHRAAGKTSLADRLLHAAGVTRRPGCVDDGTSLLDHLQAERSRRASLEPAFAWLPWGPVRIEFVDTPGGDATPGRTAVALHGCDTRVVVVDGTRQVDADARRWLRGSSPRIVVVTHGDRSPARVDPVDALRGGTDTWPGRLAEAAGTTVVWATLPMVDPGGRLVGVLDVLGERALRYADDDSGSYSPEPLADADATRVRAAAEHLQEAVALTDDGLLERYLEDFALAGPALAAGLAAAVADGRLVPAVHACPSRGIGAEPLLDLLAGFAPPATRCPRVIDEDGAVVDPQRFVAQRLATHPDGEGGRFTMFRVWRGVPSGTWHHGGRPMRAPRLYDLRGPRRSAGTGRLVATWDEVPGGFGDTYTDGPALRVARPVLGPSLAEYGVEGPKGAPPEPARLAALADEARWSPGVDLTHLGGEPVLRGIADGQLRALIARVGLMPTRPPVAWSETPSRPALGVAGTHRELDDVGLPIAFGHVVIDLLPDPGAGVTFEHAPDLDHDELPVRFHAAVEAGVREGLSRGPSGHPVVGVRVVLHDGRYDMLESTPAHFVSAATAAVAAALARAGTRLLEPWERIALTVEPSEVSPLISAIAAAGGQLAGVESLAGRAVVAAELPAAAWADLVGRLSRRGLAVAAATRDPATPRPARRNAAR